MGDPPKEMIQFSKEDFTHRRSKRAVVGLTIVDAISDSEDLDPDGGDTTVDAGVAGRASLLRNNENNHSEET